MSRRTRASVTASIVTPSQPPAVAFTLEQLATACGIRVVHLVHLVRVGVVEPEPTESEVFSASAATASTRASTTKGKGGETEVPPPDPLPKNEYQN